MVKIIVIVCWIAFWIYWLISASKAKTNLLPSDLKSFFGIRLSLVLVVALMAIIFRRLPTNFTGQVFSSNTLTSIIGLLIFLLGMALAIWARVTLAENWGMPMTAKKQLLLVTSGIYSYLRHPIYTGMLLMIMGSSITFYSSWWLIVLVASIIYFVYSAIMEEKYLSSQLGKKYFLYKSRTKMFVPFII